MNSVAVEKVNESELIQKAQTGNREAFDLLVESYYQRMVRTAMRIVRNDDDAQDVVQQAFLAAWINIEKFRGDSAFSTWLTRIVMNEGVGMLRKKSRQFVELNEAVADSNESMMPLAALGEDPEQMLQRRERERLLHLSVGEVKPVYRPAMRLRLEHDMSLEEISSRLKMPVNTVKVHLHRGRRSMKNFLEERLTLPAAA